jgi:hypothetical protein
MNVPRSSPPAPSPVDHIRKLLHAKSLFTARRFPAFALMLHAQTTDRILLQMSRMHCVTSHNAFLSDGYWEEFTLCCVLFSITDTSWDQRAILRGHGFCCDCFRRQGMCQCMYVFCMSFPGRHFSKSIFGLLGTVSFHHVSSLNVFSEQKHILCRPDSSSFFPTCYR